MQRADMSSLYAAGAGDEQESETTIEDLQSKLEEADQENQKEKSKIPGWVKYVVIGILAAIIILALVMLFLRNNGNQNEDRIARMRESRRRNDYGGHRESGAGTRRDTGTDYGSSVGQQSVPPIQGEPSSQPMPTPPNASELSSMLNQLDQEKEENEFEIFDL